MATKCYLCVVFIRLTPHTSKHWLSVVLYLNFHISCGLPNHVRSGIYVLSLLGMIIWYWRVVSSWDVLRISMKFNFRFTSLMKWETKSVVFLVDTIILLVAELIVFTLFDLLCPNAWFWRSTLTRVFKKWIALILEFRNWRLNYAMRMRSIKGNWIFWNLHVDNLYFPSR